ncbi:MAG TPA: type II secretion system F family protein [Candidatus Brocadiia bacterium]|nr:type II secretion system F family protein [Candidatus Brocadiales bacterium]
MPIYRYKARDKYGKAITGAMEAPSYEKLGLQLYGLGYIPVFLEEARGETVALNLIEKYRWVKTEHLILFTRQLATMLNAGIPLSRALESLATQTEGTKLKRIITEVRRDIEAGSTFSDALSKHGRVFSALYVSMVKAGEASGTLDQILNRLVALTEHERDTRARLKSATRYPKIVVLGITAAFTILMTFVVPKFIGIFERAGLTLPLPTRILIFINHMVHTYWYVLIGVVGIGFLVFYQYIRTKKGRRQWDTLKIKIPIIGPLFLKVAMSRFSSVLGTLYKSGLPILQALDIVSDVVGNAFIAELVKELRGRVREGEGLAQPMKEYSVFPPMVVQMVTVGEETGAMDEMLAKVSQYYDTEVDYAIKNLSTLVEPILLLFLGIMVAFLALSIFMPMWDLTQMVRR